MTTTLAPVPRALLWDLDGTLAYWTSVPSLVFGLAREYLRETARFAGWGTALLATARAYKKALANAGPATNDAVFNRSLSVPLGVAPDLLAGVTLDLIETGRFDTAIRSHIRPIEPALSLVRQLAASGRFTQIVATNPVMPSAFNRRRLQLAGYDPAWFAAYSGSEQHIGQKREARFYTDLLDRLRLAAADSLMIGNDVAKDLTAKRVGIRCFLVESEHTRRAGAAPDLVPDWSGDYHVLTKLLGEE